MKPEEELAALRRRVAELEARQAAEAAPPSVTVARDADVVQQVVGPVSQLIGTQILGRDAEEEDRRALGRYLAQLADRLVRLPLRGIDEQLGRGDGIAMPRVYVTLATTDVAPLATGRGKELRRFYKDGSLSGALKPEYDPDRAPPDQAVVDVKEQPQTGQRSPVRTLLRARLASEAAAALPRLVLLGDPGSGKSTFLNHLAWALARRGLGDTRVPVPLGWADAPHPLPIRLPLRALAGRIERDGATPRVVGAALREAVEEFEVPGGAELLAGALERGAALLLLDGLDEVPLQRIPGQVADRLTTLRAARAFCEQHPNARAVLTCRSRAFSNEMQAELGWPVATLAPLTRGQVRAFVGAWYEELRLKGQLSPPQAAKLTEQLIAAVEDLARPRLRAMAETPLLLTLMAVVLYNKSELPRDRPMLYERILELLLGQWDLVRDGQSMAQELGIPDWTSQRILPLLAALSYRAHKEATSADGRGSLPRADVHDALLRFFEAERVDDPWGKAGRCLAYMSHRSGLLVPDDAHDSYVFAHLTLQEHCAGRHLLISADPVGSVLAHRDDDRWREPLLLGMGVVQQTNPFLVAMVLRNLVSGQEGGTPKPTERWYRDLVLAAEIGADREWAALRRQPGLQVDELCADLRAGLVTLLGDREQSLPVAQRIRAGRLLGDLGDSRYPVEVGAWQAELERLSSVFGASAGYFCYVPEGVYPIGGWKPDEEQTMIALSPFWIARFPITAEQYAQFVEQGGPTAYLVAREDVSDSNQPVVGVSWRRAKAYCAWLTAQLADEMPAGYELRLSTEAEWETAASYDGSGTRRTYPWGSRLPDPDRAIYDASKLERQAPVGCCPVGVAACGALDLAGNVWEVQANEYNYYPASAHIPQKDVTGSWAPWRGGSWYSDETLVRCGARVRSLIDSDLDGGFRIVLAPSLVQMS